MQLQSLQISKDGTEAILIIDQASVNPHKDLRAGLSCTQTTMGSQLANINHSGRCASKCGWNAPSWVVYLGSELAIGNHGASTCAPFQTPGCQRRPFCQFTLLLVALLAAKNLMLDKSKLVRGKQKLWYGLAWLTPVAARAEPKLRTPAALL
jgi:hypothetical protein